MAHADGHNVCEGYVNFFGPTPFLPREPGIVQQINNTINEICAIIFSIILCITLCLAALVWCTSCCQSQKKPMTEEELKKHVYKVYIDPTDKRMWYYENKLAVPDKPGYWDRDGDYHWRH